MATSDQAIEFHLHHLRSRYAAGDITPVGVAELVAGRIDRAEAEGVTGVWIMRR